MSTFLAVYSGDLFGFNISGLAWFIPLIFGLFVLATDLDKVTFPVMIWLPWIVFLFAYLIFVLIEGEPVYFRVSPVQRTMQLICPVIVGMAVSTFRATPQLLESFIRTLRWFAYLFIAELVLIAGAQFISLGRTGLASQVMTVLLLNVFFANRYLLFSEKKDLQLWFLLAAMPVLSITRTVIVATLLTFPLSFSNIPLARRLFFLALIGVLGFAIFQLPEVQKKMFRSGEGSISSIDITDIGKNQNLDTSGRASMWNFLEAIADEKPWIGHGTGQGETATYIFTRGASGYPHNDWLLTYFDYGFLGVGVFGATILLATLHGFSRRKHCRNKNTRLLLLTGISAFVPFVLVMYTDNIMVYASFFGNLQFTILGLAYAAMKFEHSSPAKARLK